MKLKELKNTVVHTKTQAEYDELMQIYEDAGWVWLDNDKPTTVNEWTWYGKNTCVDIYNHFGYCYKKWYENKDWKIITLNEFKKEQGMSFDFKVGDILADKDGDKRKVLAICDEVCALSSINGFDMFGGWWMQEELDEHGYKKATEPEVAEMTVEEISKALGKTVKVVE